MQLLDEFQSILSRSGAHLVGQQYYGVWEGYPFSACIQQLKEPGVVLFHFRLTASLETALFKELRKSLPKGCQLTAAGGSQYRLLCSGRPLHKTDATLSSVLSTLARGFQNGGIAPSDLCPICHQTDCDAYADVGGYTAVHRACVEAMAEDVRSQAETAAHSGSYITGFIGALLGGLVASLPTIVAGYAGWLVAYLYALIPLGAYYGYKLFRGRMNHGVFLCTCIASVIHLFTIEQVTFYIAVHQAFDIWPSVVDSFRFYWEIMTPGDIVASMAMSVVFMGLGLWISWGQIRRNAYTDIRSANTVHSTLTDKAPY